MKVNSKTTNAANLICHQGGQRTVNGIIGNTRRGIRVDQTLDPDSNNPVANKPVSTALAALVGKIDAALQKPTGLTKTKLVGVGTNGQENIEIGDNLTLANGKLSATGGISVIELTDKNGTIASAQLGEINANPQNFAFKYNGKILSFTKADSTTYQYCNNTTSSSDNNVMTTSTLLTITSSTGAYTIAENVHNVVANSVHPANGGDLTNIQVGSKVYSIPSGGGGGGTTRHGYTVFFNHVHYDVYINKNYNFTIGQLTTLTDFMKNDNYKQLRAVGPHPAYGYYHTGNDKLLIDMIYFKESGYISVDAYGLESASYYNDSTMNFSQAVNKVIQHF